MIKIVYNIVRLSIGWRLVQDQGLGWENLGVYATREEAFTKQQKLIREAGY
jgi:hypothetical protein